MKFFIFFVSSFSLNAQTPDWSWAFSVHGNGNDPINYFDSDNYGDILIAGSFNSPAIEVFDTMLIKESSPWTSWSYVASMNENSKTGWVKKISVKSEDYYRSVAIRSAIFDVHGNAIIAGDWSIDGDLYIDSLMLHANGEDYNSFIIVFDRSGQLLWWHFYEDGSEPFSIVDDKSGGFYFVGRMLWYCPQIDFGDTILVNIGNENQAFIAHYTEGRTVDWAKLFNGYSNGISGFEILENDLFFKGEFDYASYQIDTFTLHNPNGNMYENFIGMLDINGNVLWVRTLSEANEYIDNVVEVDNNIEVFAHFYVPFIVLEEDTLYSSDDYGFFIATYNIAGEQIDVAMLPTDFPEYYSMVTHDDDYYIGMQISDVIWYGSDSLYNESGAADPAILTYNESLEPVSGFSLPMEDINSFPRFNWDAFGNLYLINSLAGDTLIFGIDTLINYQLTTQLDFFIAATGNCNPALEPLEIHNNVLTAPDGVSWHWYLNDLQIVDAAAQTFLPHEVGFYRASAMQENGCRIWTEPLLWPQDSIMPGSDDFPFAILPNITSGSFEIHIPGEFDQCNIYTMQGQLIAEWNGRSDLHETFFIDSPGVYLCTVIFNGQMSTKKLIIQ